MTLVDTLNKAFQNYQAGKLQAASKLCRQARKKAGRDHPDVLRLSGMVARKMGEFSKAEKFLKQALVIAPGHHEARNVLGLAYLDMGKSEEAASEFELSIQSKTDYLPAILNLSRAWLQTGKQDKSVDLLKNLIRKGGNTAEIWTAYARALQASDQIELSMQALNKALSLDSSYGPAICDLSAPLLEAGKAESVLGIATKASRDPAVSYLRLRALFDLQRNEEALELGQDILSASPNHTEALKACSQMLWMTGRGEEIPTLFETALSEGGQNEGVFLHYMKTLTQMGQEEAALDIGKRAQEKCGRTPRIDYLIADALIESGDGETALKHAEKAAQSDPDDVILACNFARSLLMVGQGQDALKTIRHARSIVPDDQFWVAMEGTALRQLGDSKYDDLMRFEEFAKPYELAAPRGYASIDDFNKALLETLLELHKFAQCPLDQSLRLGSQTSMDIKRSDDPVLKSFFEALNDPISEYIGSMKAGAQHPLLSRKNEKFHLSGAWSVKLGPMGNHVSHVHPEGWISSAYYVDVPEQVSGAEDREGWIYFGAPPFKVPNASTPEHYIEPKPGCLALFPSYMWHGTVPIKSGMRVTIAYDVVPG